MMLMKGIDEVNAKEYTNTKKLNERKLFYDTNIPFNHISYFSEMDFNELSAVTDKQTNSRIRFVLCTHSFISLASFP